MRFWLYFRCLQFYRIIRTAGWGILLFLGVLATPFWIKGILNVREAPWWQLMAASLIIVGLLHALRTDHHFLSKGKLSIRQYAGIEYGVISSLLSLIPLFSFELYSFFAGFSGVLWVFVPLGWFSGKGMNKRIIAFDGLPVDAFELRYFLRTQWTILFFSGLLLLFTVVHPAFYIAGMWMVLLVLPAGFEHLEPYSMLPVHQKASIRRWRRNARWMYFWLVPASVLLLLTHFPWWPAVLYTVASYEAFLLLLTAYKYTAWAPGRKRIYGGAIVTIGSFAALIPVGILILIGMAGWYGWKWRRIA